MENNFNNYYVWLAPKGHRCRHRFLSGFPVRGRCEQQRKYAADQQAINFNDPFIVTGQDALDFLEELQQTAIENVGVLG